MFCFCFGQDQEREEGLPLKQVDVEDILEAQRVEQEERQEKEKIRLKRLKELGLQPTAGDFAHDDAF